MDSWSEFAEGPMGLGLDRMKPAPSEPEWECARSEGTAKGFGNAGMTHQPCEGLNLGEIAGCCGNEERLGPAEVALKLPSPVGLILHERQRVRALLGFVRRGRLHPGPRDRSHGVRSERGAGHSSGLLLLRRSPRPVGETLHGEILGSVEGARPSCREDGGLGFLSRAIISCFGPAL